MRSFLFWSVKQVWKCYSSLIVVVNQTFFPFIQVNVQYMIMCSIFDIQMRSNAKSYILIYQMGNNFKYYQGYILFVMIKNFSIQTHGIYQSRPYSKFVRQDSNNCKTPKSKHKRAQMQLNTKKSIIKNPQKCLTPFKKIQNKHKNLSVDLNNNKILNSSKVKTIKNNQKVDKLAKQQSKVIRKELENKELRKTQNVQSKIQLQSSIKQQKICGQITIAKTKTPIKKFLNLIRQSKKDQYIVKRLEFHAQGLGSSKQRLVSSKQGLGSVKQKNVKHLQIEDIILNG